MLVPLVDAGILGGLPVGKARQGKARQGKARQGKVNRGIAASDRKRVPAPQMVLWRSSFASAQANQPGGSGSPRLFQNNNGLRCVK